MPTVTLRDNDETHANPADATKSPCSASVEDTGMHDLGDLWRDLGGMG